MDGEFLFCSRILEQYVIPRLKSSEISVKKQEVVAAMIKEHICRSVTNVCDYVKTCVDIISSKLQIGNEQIVLDKFVARAKKNYDQLEEYISNGRIYFTDILIKGNNCDECDDECLPKDQLHFYAIQRNLSRLRDRLLLPASNIMDHLIAGEVFTEDDKDSIIAKSTKREKNEEFLKRLCDKCNSDQFTKIFLPAIKEDHPHLEQLLQETLHDLANEPGIRDPKMCGLCFVQSSVEPKRLADHLRNKKAISKNLYTDLRNAQLPIAVKWTVLLEQIKDYRVLEDALKIEYPAVVDKVVRNGGITKECVCSQEDNNSNIDPARSVLFSETTDIAQHSDLDSMLGDLAIDSRSSVSGESKGTQQMPKKKTLLEPELKRDMDLIDENICLLLTTQNDVQQQREYQQRSVDEQIKKSSDDTEGNVKNTNTKSYFEDLTLRQGDMECGICGDALNTDKSASGSTNKKHVRKRSQPAVAAGASASLEDLHRHRLSCKHKMKTRQFENFIRLYSEERMRHLFHELGFFVDFYQLRCPEMRQACYADVAVTVDVLLSAMDQVKHVLENIMMTRGWENTEQLQMAMLSLYQDYLNGRSQIALAFIHYQESLKKNKSPVTDTRHDTISLQRNCQGDPAGLQGCHGRGRGRGRACDQSQSVSDQTSSTTSPRLYSSFFHTPHHGT